MKDLPHHLKKLVRKEMRSAQREGKDLEEYEYSNKDPYAREQTPKELKKQKKRRDLKERMDRTPTPLTPKERNKKMKNRVPVFDRINNQKQKKGAKPSQKKTPRI